jgi:hypothetical protein
MIPITRPDDTIDHWEQPHADGTTSVYSADGKWMYDTKQREQGKDPGASTGNDTNPNAGTTDDDNETGDDGDTGDDNETGDDGDTGDATARTDDDPSGLRGGAGGEPSRIAHITKAGDTLVDERNTNTGNPTQRPEGPDLSGEPTSPDDLGEPRTDDESGAHGGSATTSGGAGVTVGPLDPQTTNTGNPDNRPQGPTADPSTLPPENGTGTGRPSGSGHYAGITPDQTGGGADLSQGLGVSRGPTFDLDDDDDGPDLRGVRIGDDDSPFRAVATGDTSATARVWSVGREATIDADNALADVDPTRFEIQDLMSRGVVGGDGGQEFEVPELPWDADPTGAPGLDRPGVDALGLTPPGASDVRAPTVDSIASSIPTFGGPGRGGDLPLTVPGASRPTFPGKDAPLFERAPLERPDEAPTSPESQQPDANDHDPYEVKEPATIDVEPGDDFADDARRDDDSGAHFEIGHPDTSELDLFAVSGGTVFDVRTTNTGNPGHRPEGPSFDPSTLPPDDGTRVGRATGDEDEMDDLDIQRRTVDDDQGGHLEIGHPDTSELDLFEVGGGTVFDVRSTNTGNPGHRPEGPSFDPSTLPTDDGTRVGRDTGDEDEMDDLDIQRRTVDDDQGTPGAAGGGSYSEMTPDQIGGGPDLTQGLGLDRGPTVDLGDSGGFDASAVVVGASDLSHLYVSAPDVDAAVFAPDADLADPPVVEFSADLAADFVVGDTGTQSWLHGSHLDAAADLAIDDGPEYAGDDMVGP